MLMRSRHRRGQDMAEVAILITFMLIAMMAFTAAVPRALQGHYVANRTVLSGPF
ncbi:MAG: hypothetical protein KDD82_07335 [Planctomycetes bacterium]|nr:hypothetical protein [Planctomycetota bacterium]